MLKFSNLALCVALTVFTIGSNICCSLHHAPTQTFWFTDADNCSYMPPQPNNTEPPGTENLTIIGLLNGSYDLLLETDDQYPDVILLLGNTGAGKTTVAQILATNLSQMHYVKIPPNQYVIIDESDEIGLPTTVSKTLVPNRKVFYENGSDTPTVLYDCPGFQDNRGSVEDFAANFFLNRVIKNSKRLKLVFMIPHASVQAGERTDFPNLVGFAVNFVRDPSKYSQSIGLVITKTPNLDEGQQHISDQDVIDTAVYYMLQYREDLQDKLGGIVDPVEREAIEKKIEFVNILLAVNGNDVHDKISFGWRPEKCGRLNESETILHSKAHTLGMLNELSYNIVDPELFGFSLTDRTIRDIRTYTSEINAGIASNISSILDQLSVFFYSQESWSDSNVENIELFVKKSIEYMSSMQKLVDMKETNVTFTPTDMSKSINESFSQLSYQIPYAFENFMDRQTMFLRIFDEATGEIQERDRRAWIVPVEKFLKTVNNSADWIEFCGKVQEITLSYDFHNNIKSKCDKSDFSSWLEYVDKCFVGGVDERIWEVSKLVSEMELHIFDTVMNFAVQPTTLTMTDDDVTQVVGYFVRTSEIKLSDVKTQRLDILSAHTIFIDNSLSLSVKEPSIVIMAPRWYIHENKNINLDGANGIALPERANPGSPGNGSVGGTGSTGLDGNPGGPGGSFLGLGLEMVEGSGKLLISNNGGDGSSGQLGGHGGVGSAGNEPQRSDCSWETIPSCGCGNPSCCVFWCIGSFIGHEGKRGGMGGNGGKGAMGGLHGKLESIFFGDLSLSNINTESLNGTDGSVGEGGKGGSGGQAGNSYKCTTTPASAPDCIGTSARCNYDGIKLPPAANGGDGVSGSGLVRAGQPTYPVVEWKCVLHFSLAFQNVTALETTKFITSMQTDSKFQNRFQLRELLEELIYLERLPLDSDYNLTDIFIVYQRRINSFSKRHPELDAVHKKVVALVESTVYNKLTGLTNPRTGVIVKISDYIDSIIQTIERLEKENALVVINEERQKAVADIPKKVEKTKELISDTVLPSLSLANETLTTELDSVKDQFLVLINKTSDELWDLENQLKTAWSQLQAHQLSSALQMLSNSLQNIFSMASSRPTNPTVPIKGLVDLIGGPGALGLYSLVSNDRDKIARLEKLVEECVKYLADAIRRKEEIEATFEPMVEDLKALVDEMLGSQVNSSSSELDVSKWRLKSKVDMVRHNLDMLSDGIDNRAFMFAAGNVEHVMTLFLDLHDNIEEYRNAASFYNYMANINSANLTDFYIGDEKIRQYVLETETQVLKNHITRKVELARKAFLQWVFPFAKVFRDHYQNLFNRTSSSVEDDIRNIQDLRTVLTTYKAMSVKELDTHLLHTNFSSGLASSKPFYVWNDDDQIYSLLNGSAVQFHSDIRKSPVGYESVKFRYIEIKLRIKEDLERNDTIELEEKLHEEIQKFKVSMIHDGVSDFRFGPEYFSMVSESSELVYSFERDRNGEPVLENEVMKKFKEGEYMLSPYTIWTFSLSSAIPGPTDPDLFDGLRTFAGLVNIELTGKGIYVAEQDDLVKELEVGRYYENNKM